MRRLEPGIGRFAALQPSLARARGAQGMRHIEKEWRWNFVVLLESRRRSRARARCWPRLGVGEPDPDADPAERDRETEGDHRRASRDQPAGAAVSGERDAAGTVLQLRASRGPRDDAAVPRARWPTGAATCRYAEGYIVYWGWGEPGAFPTRPRAKPRSSRGLDPRDLEVRPRRRGRAHGRLRLPVRRHPVGGRQDAVLPKRSGGNSTSPTPATCWRGSGSTTPPRRPPEDLVEQPAGPTNTYTDLAPRPRALSTHFGVSDLANANFVIAQPPKFSDPNALRAGYCAFHDYTQPGLGSGIYNGVGPEISYTNMPYVLRSIEHGGGDERCGENAVNSGAAASSTALDRARSRDRGDRHRSRRRGHRRQRHERHESAAGTTRSTPTRTATSARGSASRCGGSRGAEHRADPRRDGRHQGQPRQLRGAVAVEQRGGGRSRLVRGHGQTNCRSANFGSRVRGQERPSGGSRAHVRVAMRARQPVAGSRLSL